MAFRIPMACAGHRILESMKARPLRLGMGKQGLRQIDVIDPLPLGYGRQPLIPIVEVAPVGMRDPVFPVFEIRVDLISSRHRE